MNGIENNKNKLIYTIKKTLQINRTNINIKKNFLEQVNYLSFNTLILKSITKAYSQNTNQYQNNNKQKILFLKVYPINFYYIWLQINKFMGPCAGMPSNRGGKSLQVQKNKGDPVISSKKQQHDKDTIDKKQQNQRNNIQLKSKQSQSQKSHKSRQHQKQKDKQVSQNDSDDDIPREIGTVVLQKGPKKKTQLQ